MSIRILPANRVKEIEFREEGALIRYQFRGDLEAGVVGLDEEQEPVVCDSVLPMMEGVATHDIRVTEHVGRINARGQIEGLRLKPIRCRIGTHVVDPVLDGQPPYRLLREGDVML
jgi:hypothetical protein